MKTLSCGVPYEDFEKIASGEAREFSIEITPETAPRYYRMQCNGREYMPNDPALERFGDEDIVDLVPVRYDTIRFYAGNAAPTSPSIAVSVEHAEMSMPTDENGYFYSYEENDQPYLLTVVTYTLTPPVRS